MITFINDKEQKFSVGLFYIFLLCLSSITQTVIIQHYYHAMFMLGYKVKIGLQNMIYKKVFLLFIKFKE